MVEKRAKERILPTDDPGKRFRLCEQIADDRHAIVAVGCKEARRPLTFDDQR